jgi:ATP-binding cassette subfamily C protein
MFSADTKRYFLKSIVEIGIFSAAANVLLLVVPLYLLQVYDRVLPSSSMDTLVYVSLFSKFFARSMPAALPRNWTR